METRCKGAGAGLREMSSVAIDFYTEIESVYIDYNVQKHWKSAKP